jgi:hypothetical protein
MPREFSGLGNGSTAAKEASHMGVATRCMEVGHPVPRTVWYSDTLKVLLYHQPGLLSVKARKERLVCLELR